MVAVGLIFRALVLKASAFGHSEVVTRPPASLRLVLAVNIAGVRVILTLCPWDLGE